jgi:hypothetical protein
LHATQLFQLACHLDQPRLKRLNLIGQLDDALDACEIHALVLRQALHFAQQFDIVL